MPTSSTTSSHEESDNGLPPPGSRWGRGAQSVLPYLTKTLQMFTHIVNAVTDWATHLVFSPVVWFGVLLGGVGIVLIVVSGMVRSRRLGTSTDGPAKELPAARGSRSAPVVTETDPELAEIEAILRKRGIS